MKATTLLVALLCLTSNLLAGDIFDWEDKDVPVEGIQNSDTISIPPSSYGVVYQTNMTVYSLYPGDQIAEKALKLIPDEKDEKMVAVQLEFSSPLKSGEYFDWTTCRTARVRALYREMNSGRKLFCVQILVKMDKILEYYKTFFPERDVSSQEGKESIMAEIQRVTLFVPR